MIQQNLKNALQHTTKTWLALSLEILITAASFVLFNFVGLSEGIGLLLTFVVCVISVAIGIAITYKTSSSIALPGLNPSQEAQTAYEKAKQWSRRQVFGGIAAAILLLLVVIIFFLLIKPGAGAIINPIPSAGLDFNNAIIIVINHFPLFLVLIGGIFFFLSLFNVNFKSFTIHMVSHLAPTRTITIGIATVFLLLGMVLQFGSGFYRVAGPPFPLGTPTVIVPASPTPTPLALASSLIPSGEQPIINDPLKNNSQGYQWDIYSAANGSCNFVNGHYLLTSPAGSDGVECNTNSSNSVFGNFVYQIQMTILTGVDNGQSGAGPIFRVNTSGNGQQYQVLFNDKGDWDVATDTNDIPDISGISCANPCPYFHQGHGQPNIITIRADGDSIQIDINGYPLSSYINNTYTTGYIGVQLEPGTDNSSVAFSNLEVWKV